MGDRRFAVVAVLLLLSSSAPALEGTAIISTQTQTFLYNAATGRKTVLFNTGTNGACFPPDGRRVAAIPASQRLGIYDNDGTHGQVTPCSMVGTRHLNWCSNGYIYWPSNEGSPQRGHVYRMNAITKQVELMYKAPSCASRTSR